MEIISLYGMIIIMAVGIIAFLIGRLTSTEHKDNKRLEMEVEQGREELIDYRSQVTNHFQETAHRVNALTESYRNVHEHLAQGAHNLCDKHDALELMNELNRNPVLSDHMVEDTLLEQEMTSTEPNTEIDPAPGSATAGADEDHIEFSEQETDKNSEADDDSETDGTKTLGK